MKLITTNTDLLNDLRSKIIDGLQQVVLNCNEQILNNHKRQVDKKGNIQIGYSVNLSTFDEHNDEIDISDITGEFHDLPEDVNADDFIGITDSLEFVFDTPFGIKYITKEELSIDTIASLYDFVLSFPQQSK